MKTEKIVKFCDKTIEILILGVLFLVPLYFNIFTYLSFEIDKIVLFRVITEIALFFYLVRIFLSGKIVIIKNKYFYFSLLFIILSQIIATIFSARPFVSFWGSYWRNFGLFTYLHIFIFVYLSFVYFSKEKIKTVFYVISLSGFFVSLYALMQSFGFDFLRWQNAVDGYQLRPSSTIGQPNFLASYLLLVIPATFYLLFLCKNFYKRIILIIILLFQFLAMILTYSRAAWIGFLLASFVFVLFYIYKKNKKYFLASIIFVFVCFSFLAYLNVYQKIYIPPDGEVTLLGRIKSVASFGQGSIGIRFFYYESAFDIIRNGPIFGHGLDNQGYQFYKYYIPEYAIYEQINRYTDKSHNEILDVLITTGIIGLFAWVFFFFVFVKQGFDWLRNNSDKKERLLMWCLFFGILSFYISIQFSFFTIVPAVYFWFFVAVWFKLVSLDRIQEKIFYVKKSIVFLFLLTMLIFVIFFIWDKNMKINVANHYYRKVKEAAMEQKIDLTFEYFNNVLRYAPNEPYYRAQFAIEMLPIVISLDSREERMFALDYLKDVLNGDKNETTFEQRIYSALVLSEKGRIKYAIGGIENSKSEFTEAESIFEELTKEAPGFSQLFYYWGNLYLYQGEYGLALGKYYEALISYPALDHPDMNIEHRGYVASEMGDVYRMMVETTLAQKEYLNALFFCRKALTLIPGDLYLIDRLNTIYAELGDNKRLENSIKHSITLYPDNYKLYFQLAVVFGSLNKEVEAFEYAKKYLEFYPDDQQAREFINNLKLIQNVE